MLPSLTARAAGTGRNLDNADGMHDSAKSFKSDGSGMLYMSVSYGKYYGLDCNNA